MEKFGDGGEERFVDNGEKHYFYFYFYFLQRKALL